MPRSKIAWGRIFWAMLGIGVSAVFVVLLLAANGCHELLGSDNAASAPVKETSAKYNPTAGSIHEPADGALIPTDSQESHFYRRLAILLKSDDVEELFASSEDRFLRYASVAVATWILLVTVSTFNPVRIDSDKPKRKD